MVVLALRPQIIRYDEDQFNDDSNRWLGRAFIANEDTPRWFTMDLGAESDVDLIRIKQTANNKYQNSGTQNFTIEVGTPGVLTDFAAGALVNSSSGNISLASLLVDGDDATCTDLLLDTSTSWFLVDLGREVNMEEFRFVTRDHVLVNLIVLAGTDRGNDNGWNMKPCTSVHDRDFYRLDTFSDRVLVNEFRVTCRRRVRYITVTRPDTRYSRVMNHICSFRVMVAEGEKWETVQSSILPPAFAIYPEVIPFVDIPLKLRARFVRFNAFSTWAELPGLSGFQVWSRTPARRYLIVNGQSENTTRRPGLLGEWFEGFDFMPGGRQRLDHEYVQNIGRGAVRGYHIVPQIHFPNGYEITQHGSLTVQRPESTAAIIASGSYVDRVEVHFLYPLLYAPVVSLAIHHRHGAFPAAGLVLRAEQVTTQGFLLVVMANGTSFDWDAFPIDAIVGGGMELTWSATTVIGYSSTNLSAGSWNKITRVHGLLQVDFADIYTFTLQADDEASFAINGSIVISCSADGIIRHDRNSAMCVGRVFLAPGDHAIEIIHVQRYGPASLALYWRRGNMADMIVPASSLFHRIPKLCLVWSSWSQVSLHDCDPGNPRQLFDISASQIELVQPFRRRDCLTVKDGTSFFLTSCGFGGRNIATAENTPTDRASWPGGRFNFVDGQLKSETRRNIGRLNCSYPYSGSEWWHKQYRCEIANALPAPHLCVRGPAWPIVGTLRDHATIEECAAIGDSLEAKWHFEEVSTPAPVPVRVWNNSFQFTRNGYMRAVRADEQLGWPELLLATDNSNCQKYSEGNTCEFACDGSCTAPFAGTVNPFAGSSCPAGTDQYDCDAEERIKACGRFCEANPNCGGFNVYNTHVQQDVRCYFFTIKLPEVNNRAYYSDEWDLYQRLSAPTETPMLAVPRPKTCASIGDEPTCVLYNACEWFPIPGQSIAAPQCTDINTYPLGKSPYSCGTYFREGDCTSNDAAASICAITCNRTEFCPGLKMACQDRQIPRVMLPTVSRKLAVCSNESSAIAVHDKCVCDIGTSCSGTSCLLSTAGNKRSQLSFFMPDDCPSCACLHAPENRAEPVHSTVGPTEEGSYVKADSEESEATRNIPFIPQSEALPGEAWIGIAGLLVLVVVSVVHMRLLQSHPRHSSEPSCMSHAGSKNSIAPLLVHVIESPFTAPRTPPEHPMKGSQSWHPSSGIELVTSADDGWESTSTLGRHVIRSVNFSAWALPPSSPEEDVPSTFFSPGIDTELKGYSA